MELGRMRTIKDFCSFWLNPWAGADCGFRWPLATIGLRRLTRNFCNFICLAGKCKDQWWRPMARSVPGILSNVPGQCAQVWPFGAALFHFTEDAPLRDTVYEWQAEVPCNGAICSPSLYLFYHLKGMISCTGQYLGPHTCKPYRPA